MPATEPGIAVAQQSSERAAMDKAWRLISDVCAGAPAIRHAGADYLPKYEKELPVEYDRRRNTAPWRPEFTDALRHLAGKPFSRDVGLVGKPSERVKQLAEDIDARGNSQTVFAREAFAKGISKGLHAILVDYPTVAPEVTREEEQQLGVRPYWLHIPAENILALYTRFEGGREVVDHIRFREIALERDGFTETKVERIRVLEPGFWQVWERRSDRDKFTLAENGTGTFARGPKGLTSVPVALFYTGEREGSLRVKPPLLDLAHMQIELYQALSRQDEILTFAGAPMLCGKGLAPPSDGSSIEVGPKRVLFAPPGIDGSQTGWEFVQPNAANIKEIRDHVASIVDDMRRLGMQPLTPRSGDITATASSTEAAKAHSAVQAWAVLLKDALEQAWVFTCEWLGEEPNVEVSVSTDFAALPYAQAPLDALDKGRARGDLSRLSYFEGLKRHDVLPPDFDAEAEDKRIGDEQRAAPAPAPTPQRPAPSADAPGNRLG